MGHKSESLQLGGQFLIKMKLTCKNTHSVETPIDQTLTIQIEKSNKKFVFKSKSKLMSL